MATVRWREGWAHLVYKNPKTGKWTEKSLDIHESSPESKTKARACLTRHENMVLNGEWDFFDNSMSWAEFKAAILKVYNRPPMYEKGGTYEKYFYAFKAFEEILKPATMREIDTAAVTRYVLEREKAVNPTTLSIDFRMLRAAFNLGVTLKYIKSNPFKEIAEPKPPKTTKKTLTGEEMTCLLDAAKQGEYENEEAWLMLMLFIFAGLRRQELTHIRIKEDIRIHPIEDEGSVSVNVWWKPGKKGIDWKPKDNEERDIPLVSAVVRALRVYIAKLPPDQVLLFPGESGNVRDKSALNKLFKRLVIRASKTESGKKLNLLRIGGKLHLIRHTFVSEALKTMQAKAVQEIAGHADIDTTMGYNHITSDVKKQAMATFNLQTMLPESSLKANNAIPALPPSTTVIDATIVE